MRFVLYHTLGCHLCEQALALWQRVTALPLELVDIADDHGLMDAYGIRIPVIRAMHTKAELLWPFNDAQLHQFIEINRVN
jgi:hypothetical protein